MKITFRIKSFVIVLMMLIFLLALLFFLLPAAKMNDYTGAQATNGGKIDPVEIDTPHMLTVSEIFPGNGQDKPDSENLLFDKNSLTGKSLQLSVKDLIDKKKVTKELAITNLNTKKPVEYTIIISTAAEAEQTVVIFQKVTCEIIYKDKRIKADPRKIVLTGTLVGSGKDIFQIEFSYEGGPDPQKSPEPQKTHAAESTESPENPINPGNINLDISVSTYYKEKYTHYISAPSHFTGLLDDEKSPALHSGAEIILLKDITVDLGGREKYLTVTKLFSLDLNGMTLKLQNGPLAVNCHDKGSIEISSGKEGGSLRHEGFFINAPYAKVYWDEKICPVSERDMEFFMNVETFNNKTFPDKTLGGKGKNSLLSLSFEKSKNKTLSHDIQCSIQGNLITVFFPYHVDFSLVDSLVPTFEADGGEVKLTFKDPGDEMDFSREGILTVTDAEGSARNYLIKAELKYNSLPCIFITTENGKEITSKTEYVNGFIKIRGSDKVPYGSSLGKIPVQIRGRGNTTWEWEKKPYKLKFNSSVSILGLPANRDWVLLANYSDKSLIRNHIAYEAAKKLKGMDFNPTTLLVDVFLNGKYVGVYSIGESIEAAGHRVNIEKNSTDPNTGYLLEVGGTDTGDVVDRDYFHADGIKFIAIKSPKKDVITKEQIDYIRNYVREADAAIRSGQNIEKYIDINSFVDWFIIHELFHNADSGFRRSCFLTKDKDGKLKMGPVWDFDISMGNAFSTYEGWATADNDYVKTTWASYLLKNPAFTRPLKARWNEVKKMLLDSAMKNIDYCYEIIYDSQVENFKVWDILNKKVGFNPKKVVAANSYDKQIQYLKDYINNRYKWLDKAIGNL